MLIEDASLTIAGSITGGNGAVVVGETISPVNGNAVTLTASLPNDPSDSVTFPGTTQVGVLKDALTFSYGGLASLSAIQQRFSTAGGNVPVPEPTTLALLGIGLLGVGMTRHRRKG